MASLVIVATVAVGALVMALEARRETSSLQPRLDAIEGSAPASLDERVKALEMSLTLHIGATPGYSEGDFSRLEKDLYHHIYGESEKDLIGATPSEVVRRYVNAEATEDWSQAYGYLGEVPPEVTQDTYVEEVARTHADLVNYSVGDFVLRSEDHAVVAVSVTYRYETGDRKLDQVWAVVKVDGLWKVRWMAAQ